MFYSMLEEKRRIAYILLVIFCGFGILNMNGWMSQTEVSVAYQEDVPSCAIHQIDVFDPRVMKYVKKTAPPKCAKLQKNILNFTSDGRVTFINVDVNTTKCHYQEVVRKRNSDGSVKFLKKEVLQDGHVIPYNVSVITCKRGDKTVYEDAKIFVHKREGTISSPPDTPSVFMFGLDSLSAQNSLRQLKKVNEFMKTKLKAHHMKYHIKTGENTFPNLVAMTTGKSTYKRPPELTHCEGFKCPKKSEFFDDWPFIWKEFAKMGYTTAMGEGMRSIEGGFNYLLKGFRHPPTHHYVRPYYLALKKLQKEGTIAKKRKNNCGMDRPKYHALIDWVEALVTTYAGTPLFVLSLSGYTHDSFSEFQILDEPYAKMLESLYHKGLLNNTIVIGFGDHGFRFGSFRKTWMGRTEDAMPWMSVSLPSWMKTSDFHLEESLSYNERSLTTHFDIHATLKDVVDKNFAFNESVFHEKNGRGISLFKKIPRQRTCADAGVLDPYCPCFKEEKVSKITPQIEKAARDAVDYINKVLLKGKTMCEKLHSPEIRNVFNMFLQRDSRSKNHYHAGLRMDIKLQPSNGLFECNFAYEYFQKKYKLSGIIQRKDMYGDQGKCVSDGFLEKYCHCKKS